MGRLFRTVAVAWSVAGLVGVTAMIANPAVAQTAKTPPAAAQTVKTLLDNARVTVAEISIRPGATITLPSHPDQLAYLLTDARLVFQTPGRTPYQLDFKAGEATLLPANSTHARNEGDKEVRAVLVEIKPTSRAAPAQPKSSRKGKSGRRR